VVVSYSYDPLGRRSTRSTSFWPGGPQNTVVQTYLHDGEDVLRERFALLFHARGADYDAHVYTHGPGIDEPLEVEHGTGEVWYYHADALGSIVRMTDGEQNVIPEMSRQYDAFGRLEAGAGEAGYAYTGREWDPEAELYYYRARYYPTELGRFLSGDPTARLIEYLYVGNNPISYTDPSGYYIFRPEVEYRPGIGDEGLTQLFGPRATFTCKCEGSQLEFTVEVRIVVTYTIICDDWSRAHEGLHVASFLQKTVLYANQYLKPFEGPYPTREQCRDSGRMGRKIFGALPRAAYDQGREEIDRYFPCVWQF
jgi:RHS repeat-associated protein